MSDELQSVADDLTAEAQEVMAELVRLSEIADSQRQAGDVSDLVETQDAIIKLDTELLTYIQQVGEMQYEAFQRAEAERDAALAEVAKLRAVLPKWRKVPWIENRWELHLVDKHNVVCVNSRGWWHRHQSEHTREYESRDAAMRAAEAWLGLPQCEVVE